MADSNSCPLGSMAPSFPCDPLIYAPALRDCESPRCSLAQMRQPRMVPREKHPRGGGGRLSREMTEVDPQGSHPLSLALCVARTDL